MSDATATTGWENYSKRYPCPMILTSPGEDEYKVTCGCGFTAGFLRGYDLAYDVAERHLTRAFAKSSDTRLTCSDAAVGGLAPGVVRGRGVGRQTVGSL